ncbi:MAG: hypothetical protein GVY11_00790 [Gammaproteobacteria bacterium]|jgi:hypothetical protein|nr:hypothetical protein [Gammaproteobacteria bacterium]
MTGPGIFPRRSGTLIVLAIAIFVVGCATGGQAQRERQQAMDQWRAMVRWSEYDGLVDMIHPEWLEENPIRSLEIERLRQFRVTEYRVRQVISDPEGLQVERHVQIRLYHVHSARERVIRHRELWRWDETRERWLLHSGLPDPRRN